MTSHESLHDRARRKGVNPVVYWLVRAVIEPFFRVYFRMEATGAGHAPRTGPVIWASNHRSFLDPFILGCTTSRPLYYVAKQELFSHRLCAWVLNALGAFPVRRGGSDAEMFETAKAILARGDAVLIFPEGTRVRPGPLGAARRGVGRLALETGAPVLPVAIHGTERVRRGWRIRPHKVRVRFGAPLRVDRVATPTPELAQAVTDRVWPQVQLQWEWLGGEPPIRRAAVIGADPWARALAAALDRAGVDVEIGWRPGERAEGVAGRVRPRRSRDLDLATQDLVCFAVPASQLPAAVAEHAGSVARRARVAVRAGGLVPPLDRPPDAYVAERVRAHGIVALAGHADAELVVASSDRALRREIATLLGAGGARVSTAAHAGEAQRELARPVLTARQDAA